MHKTMFELDIRIIPTHAEIYSFAGYFSGVVHLTLFGGFSMKEREVQLIRLYESWLYGPLAMVERNATHGASDIL